MNPGEFSRLVTPIQQGDHFWSGGGAAPLGTPAASNGVDASSPSVNPFQAFNSVDPMSDQENNPLLFDLLYRFSPSYQTKYAGQLTEANRSYEEASASRQMAAWKAAGVNPEVLSSVLNGYSNGSSYTAPEYKDNSSLKLAGLLGAVLIALLKG